MTKRRSREVYHSFKELNSKRFPREKHSTKIYRTFNDMESHKFPNEDRVIKRISNLTEFKNWENINIWHYGSLISPRDVVATQYYAAQRIDQFGLAEEYGTGNWQEVHYMVVAEMNLRTVLGIRREILEIYKKGYNTPSKQIESRREYESLLEQVSKKLPQEIVDNFWRNHALANFITIINSTNKKKQKITYKLSVI